MADPAQTLGVVLAGGENRRYGSHKALDTVGGIRIIDRVIASLREACERVVIVANEVERYRSVGLPVRSDVRPRLGSLGGIYTAVRWASEEGRSVALCAACDMPFLSGALLRELVRMAGAEVLALPASDGPRGMEPLCAAYGVGAVGAIERALARGERAVISFFPELEVRLLGRDEVARYGEPERLFLNINRPEDRARAEKRLSSERGPTTGREEA